MKYVAPEMNIVMFNEEDVIVASVVTEETAATTTEDPGMGGEGF